LINSSFIKNFAISDAVLNELVRREIEDETS